MLRKTGYADLHVHSTFSDGKDSPEDIVRYALDLGMRTVGFTDHSFTPFDTSYCIPESRLEEYRETIKSLREKYAGKIGVLCGIEQDLFSEIPAEGYDYVIGSVHYFRLGEEYVPVDFSAERLRYASETYFSGDFIALAEEYFRLVGKLAEMKADIIGHLDLITKFNSAGALFDESDKRYLAAARNAIDRILSANPGQLFEINTGVISRGYRRRPYPSRELKRYISSKGGRFILTGDTHKKEKLCYLFEKYERPGIITKYFPGLFGSRR